MRHDHVNDILQYANTKVSFVLNAPILVHVQKVWRVYLCIDINWNSLSNYKSNNNIPNICNFICTFNLYFMCKSWFS